MKRALITTAAGGLCLAFILNAAITADPDATAAAPAPARTASKGLVPDENLKIVERGADQRVWERKVTVPLPGGRTATELRRFTELATGMHVKQADGSWKEASDEIVITPGGAALLGTRHKVYFPADIGKGVLRIVLPDGREMSSRPLGLGYSDGSQSVLIAELKSSVSGQLMPSKRQVVYADAFIGVHADLVVSVSISGLESDVVFREQPGTPESLQLNPATARLQVLTEWFGGIEPVKRLVGGTTSTPTPSGATPAIPLLPDTELSFGSMRMGAGKAFGTADGQREGRGVRVSKSWTKLGSGRTFLMEEVPFEAVRRQLQKLPRLAAVSGSKPFMALRSDLPDTPLPEARAIESGRGAIELAQADLKQDGFVMDYVINLTVYNYGPFTFANNTTYYISGPVYVGWWNEPVTLEGGAVIKFADSGSISLVGPLTCKTAPYRPAVFTSENDLSVGEPVGYGTPTRGTGTYLYDYGGNATLQHVRFAYAGTAWDTTVGFDAEFWHCQFVNCGTAVYRESTGNNYFFNVLAAHCGSLLYTPDYSALYGEHLTLDNCDSLGIVNNASLSNTLITGGDLGSEDLSWVSMGSSYQDNTGTAYQSAAGGHYYLASESGYRNAGTASINAQLLADLGKLTTYPPAVYESATLDTVQTLGPQAPRGGLDIGYHYDPLDYVFAGSDVNANLTFAPGTVVGWYRTSQGWQHAGHGIHLDDNVTLTFDGRADAPTYYVRCNTVQEADNQLYYGPGGITGWALSAGNAPSLVARFTRFSMLGSEWANHYRDDWGYLKIAATHSEFWGGGVGSYGSQHNYTNCLFDRAIIYLQTSDTDLMCLNMRNCTMIGGQLGTHHWSSAAWPQSIRDCIFDGTVVTYSGLTTADADYNAFLTGANRVSPQGAHDVVVGTFDWQASYLGSHYQGITDLVNMGSRNAANAGLYHFTTRLSQEKETTSTVDIGYHYVAKDSNGSPLDTDGDGVPDYLEDANGNGLADNGETEWDKPTITVTASTPIAKESGLVAGAFTVSRQSGDISAALNVTVAMGGGANPATAGSDYITIPTTVTIDPGQNSKVVNVTPLDDSVDEADEAVVMTVVANAALYNVGSPAAATVTIQDKPTITVTASTPTAKESGLVAGAFTVSRQSGNISAALNVTVGFAGSTATAGSDYTTISTTVTIDPGQNSKVVNVTPLDDSVDEADETVVMTVAANAALYNVGSPAAATVTILNKATVSVSTTEGIIYENGTVSGQITVTRTGPSGNAALPISFTLSGAANGVDFATITSPVIIQQGANSATIALTPIDNLV